MMTVFVQSVMFVEFNFGSFLTVAGCLESKSSSRAAVVPLGHKLRGMMHRGRHNAQRVDTPLRVAAESNREGR